MEVARISERRATRRDATRNDIVEAAWALARAEGLGAVTVRDIGARVGLRASSLYTYFASKHEIHDAMFANAASAFEAMLDESGAALDVAGSVEGAAGVMRAFVRFCAADSVRFQMLFQRTLPGFVPSAESYAIAQRAYETMAAYLSAVGVNEPDAVDLWTAVATGLASQQIANDPGGNRWLRLADLATRMLLDATSTAPVQLPIKRTGRTKRRA